MNDSTYRRLVQEMWRDGLIEPSELKALVELQRQLEVGVDEAARIEREVMGMTKEEAFVSGMGAAGGSAGTGAGAGAGAGGLTLSGASTQAGGSPMPRSSVVEPGMLLRGRYEVEAEVGRGGMGQVLRVMDRKLGERRALKVLAPEHVGRPDLLERMRREVRLSQRLRHPGIMQVFDYDEDPESGAAFFTMEFVEGQTLRRWMGGRKGAGAALEDVERISAALISAIGYAHREGVVHLDLKPENVMVTGDLSSVRILDFGISRALDVEGLQTMLTGAGTPYYMAPEQEAGARDVGPAADVYSLGAILYELLVGAPPRGAFSAPADLRPEVGRAASDLVMTALRPDPAERPEAAALALSFAAAAGALSIGCVPDEALYTATPRDERTRLLKSQRPEDQEAWLAAAESGDAYAQFLLARAFGAGIGPYEESPSREAEWYRKAADQGHNPSMNNLASIISEDHPEEAVRWYRMAAEQGNANAQFNLGYAYSNGEGVREDKEEAVRWYRMAAEQGNANAQVNLGYAYDAGEGVREDKEEAVRWYRMAAEQGNADAQVNLGVAYAVGEGVREDKEEAVRWYRTAAEQGNAAAQYYLGLACFNGEGVREDKEEAVRWYRMAAEQGNARAQCRLGCAYDVGEGVREDKEEAVRWYRTAAEQGNAAAQYYLGLACFNGEGVREDKEEAVRWYRMAAEQGNARAQCRLGYAYDVGEGVREDKEEAVRWYRIAAEQGDAYAQFNLGYSYFNGEGVREDKEEAVRWYRMAAEQGNARAQRNLGYAYSNGEGVREDKEEAMRWYRMAAEQGDADAQTLAGGEEAGMSDLRVFVALLAFAAVLLAPVALIGWGVKAMISFSAVAATLTAVAFYDDDPLPTGLVFGALAIGLSGIAYALWSLFT